MSVLTTSQLTFCDLRDSYSVYVDTECVGVVCDKNGLVIQEKNIEIKYRAFAGSELVGASCSVSNLPSGVTFTGSTDSTNTEDGSFSLNIAKALLNGTNIKHNIKETIDIVKNMFRDVYTRK